MKKQQSKVWGISLAAVMTGAAAITPALAQDRFLLLATNRTGTMERELNEAGEQGYRFAATQGGETAFGSNEAVVIMALDPEGRRYEYILLATNRTGTMQRELNETPAGFRLVGMTVFTSMFGGKEVAAILEAEVDPERAR